jgi:hypothetical protein
VTRARNYALLGKYTEAIGHFGEIIAKVNGQMGLLNDRNLIMEWNRLLDMMTREREMASNMREITNGNLPAKEARRERPRVKEEHSESEVRLMKGYSEDNHDERKLSAQAAHHPRKPAPPSHEDDELYNRKEKEARESEREQRDKEARDREFE